MRTEDLYFVNPVGIASAFERRYPSDEHHANFRTNTVALTLVFMVGWREGTMLLSPGASFYRGSTRKSWSSAPTSGFCRTRMISA